MDPHDLCVALLKCFLFAFYISLHVLTIPGQHCHVDSRGTSLDCISCSSRIMLPHAIVPSDHSCIIHQSHIQCTVPSKRIFTASPITLSDQRLTLHYPALVEKKRGSLPSSSETHAESRHRLSSNPRFIRFRKPFLSRPSTHIPETWEHAEYANQRPRVIIHTANKPRKKSRASGSTRPVRLFAGTGPHTQAPQRGSKGY